MLALADRLDTLTGLFGAGLAPKGSADPFGLRRAALGVVQILVANEIDVDLVQALEIAALASANRCDSNARAAVLDFIRGRLEVWLLDQNYSHDAVQSVLAEQSTNPIAP